MKLRFIFLLVTHTLVGMDLVKNLEIEYIPMHNQQDFFLYDSADSSNNLTQLLQLALLRSLHEYVTGNVACIDPECNFTSANVNIILNHLHDNHAYTENSMLESAYSRIYRIYGDQKFMCSFCNHQYITFSFLKAHLALVHPDLFNRPQDSDNQLSVGIIEPTVIPPWSLSIPQPKKIKEKECPYCKKKIIGNLELHFKRKHIPAKEQELFFCGIDGCDKTYTTKSSLNLHITRCHKEKLYDCEYCSKSYALPGDLNRHISHTHKKTHSR